VSAPEKPDIPGWFGLRRPWVLTVARPLGPILSGVVMLLFVLAVAAAGAILLHAIFDLGLGTPRTGFGTGAVIVALLGAPFVIWRAVVAQRQADIAQEGQITDRINTAVQGLGAEKVVKERVFVPIVSTSLGHISPGAEIERQIRELPVRGKRGTWELIETTEPNLEVRIGAIYALERIAQDSDRDHVQIMEILCAYIRQNSPAPAEDDWPEPAMGEWEDIEPLEEDWLERLMAFREEQREAMAGLKLREDIQVAVEVIGRRSEKQRRLEAGRGVETAFPFDRDHEDDAGPEEGYDQAALEVHLRAVEQWKETLRAYEGYRLDLRSADLRGADLSGMNLNGAMLDGSCLQGAHLWRTNLHGADLTEAGLQGAHLWETRLKGAHLWNTRLQGVVLRQAWLQGADLREAQLQGAVLWQARLQGANFEATRLQGAHLQGARLQGADLEATRLQGANLLGAQLQGAHLWEARLQGAELKAASFDSETDLTGTNLRGAAVTSVDLADIPHIADHLEGMFGDGSVTLLEGCDWPEHWPRHELGPEEFNEEWRKWQADPEGYTPPDPPDTAR